MKLPEKLLRDLIMALLVQILHEGGHIAVVPGEEAQKALQVAGDQNVHGGGGGLIEGAALIIDAGGEEVGKDIVAIGGADQAAYGQAHALGKIPGQDVAEVAGGDTEMDRLAYPDAATADQVGVGLEIVDDLGGQAADIDGVGRGETQTGEILLVAGGEDLLYAGLGIVEIAPDSADLYIGTLLGDHLSLLHGGDAAVGVEHNDLGAGDIVEALQGCLARVTGGGGENEHFIPDILQGTGLTDELGQQAQGHILKGTGGAPEQLQHIAVAHLYQRGQLLCLKFPGVAPADQTVHIRVVRQQGREDAGGEGEGVRLQERLPVKNGDGFGHIESPVRRDAPEYGGSGRGRKGAVAGALIFHTSFSNLFLAFCIMI